MKPLRIDYDPDYGIDHRRGWSVHYDGSVLVQFAPTLMQALWRAWRKWRFVLSSLEDDATRDIARLHDWTAIRP